MKGVFVLRVSFFIQTMKNLKIGFQDFLQLKNFILIASGKISRQFQSIKKRCYTRYFLLKEFIRHFYNQFKFITKQEKKKTTIYNQEINLFDGLGFVCKDCEVLRLYIVKLGSLSDFQSFAQCKVWKQYSPNKSFSSDFLLNM